MPQQFKIGKHATRIYTDPEGYTHVIYHKTPVVVFDNYKVFLNTGGYKTVTTKTRMNQAANQLALGFQVYQRKGQWFVKLRSNGRVFSFQDMPSMIISRDNGIAQPCEFTGSRKRDYTQGPLNAFERRDLESN